MFKPFRCPDCGVGTIDFRAKKGETYALRYGIDLVIPKDLPLLYCDKCNNGWSEPKSSKSLKFFFEKTRLFSIGENCYCWIQKGGIHFGSGICNIRIGFEFNQDLESMIRLLTTTRTIDSEHVGARWISVTHTTSAHFSRKLEVYPMQAATVVMATILVAQNRMQGLIQFIQRRFAEEDSERNENN